MSAASTLTIIIGGRYDKSLQLSNGIDSTGAVVPIDLTGATVTFHGLDRDSETAVELFSAVTCTITDAVNGLIDFTVGSAATTALTPRTAAYQIKIVYAADPTNPLRKNGKLIFSGGAQP